MGRHVRRSGRVRVLFVVVVLAILSVAFIYILAARHQDDEKRAAETAKQAAQAQASTIADPILALCSGGGDAARVLESARTPDGVSVCAVSAGVKDSLPPPPPAGLSSAQVQSLINQALAKQQPAQPSSAQLAAAVQAFIAANPTLFKAPAPTAAQIQTAVNNYMRTHPAQQTAPTLAPYVNPPFPGPQYDMPGLGGFSGAPGGVWQQPWPRQGPRQPR